MNDVAEKLAARALIYRLFHSLMSEPPTRETLEVTLSLLASEALQLCETDFDAMRLKSLRESFATDPEAVTRDAQDQYQRLFYQPGRLAAPPWESSYVSSERKVFQACTLDARKAYREQGLRVRAVNRIPDDHIAIELGFLSEMARRMCEGDEQEQNDSLEASRRFLLKHLLCWVNEYTHDAESAAKGEFYCWVCGTLRGFVAADAALLSSFPTSVPCAVAV